ncbi:MAG TPA: glycosyltransferase family 1 protein [bacterium]|nr:glycosyltransferase family 1 protein [bacterium]
MRIAYFTESLPPLTDGVAHTFTRLAETLNEQQIDFRIISPSLPTETEPWRGRVIKVPSIPFPLYRYYRIGLPPILKLEKILNEFKPDLIHVSAPTPISIYGQNYAFRHKLPSVAGYHTNFVDYFPYYGLGWALQTGWKYMKWFHNRSQMTFVPTPGAVSTLISKGFKGVQLWPRGIDRQKFSPLHRDENWRQSQGLGKEPLLLFVGRLVAEKNLAELVQAAQILRKKGYQFKLGFAGDGPYGKILKEKFPNDLFFGFIKGQELSKVYASSDFFIFPSTTETFGNVVLEAFASGLPVIGANKGGSADLIHHQEDGLLANPHDGVDFARQIEWVLRYPVRAKNLQKKALETAEHYNWPTINGRLISQYETLIQNHSGHKVQAALGMAHPKKRRKSQIIRVQKSLI